MSKKKLDLRETFIDLIIKKSHGRPKDYQSNHAFLESLTIDELQRMSNDEDEEDEFSYEINYSFNDDENEFVLSYE
jgi:chromosome segregation and condensation protein ScpB